MKAVTLAIVAAMSTLAATSAQAASITEVLLARAAVEQGTATDNQKAIVSRFGN